MRLIKQPLEEPARPQPCGQLKPRSNPNAGAHTSCTTACGVEADPLLQIRPSDCSVGANERKTVGIL